MRFEARPTTPRRDFLACKPLCSDLINYTLNGQMVVQHLQCSLRSQGLYSVNWSCYISFEYIDVTDITFWVNPFCPVIYNPLGA
ncbi:hypothetical protein EAE90_20880 [Photorhabdus caribbeanensis]|nr:hypothetical protein [Photorhabdus caribbeanensis]